MNEIEGYSITILFFVILIKLLTLPNLESDILISLKQLIFIYELFLLNNIMTYVIYLKVVFSVIWFD